MQVGRARDLPSRILFGQVSRVDTETWQQMNRSLRPGEAM